MGHVFSNLVGYDCLLADAQAAPDSLAPKEVEAQTTAGACYIRDLIPEGLREGALAKAHQLSQAEILEPYRTQRIAKDGSVVEVSMVSTAYVE